MKIKIELTNGEMVAGSLSYEYDNITSAWHGEWSRNYQEESSHEPPEDYDSLGEIKID